MIALIDADVLLYRYAHACQDLFAFDEGDPVVCTQLPAAKHRVSEHLEMVLDETDSDAFICCWSGPENFREKLFDNYKANRKKPKPALFAELRAWMKERFRSYEYPLLEADDLLGILHTDSPEDTVVCTIDKDLDQIPGQHYNWDTGARYELSEAQADRWFYIQSLSGDSTDGIPGCPSVGKKRASSRVDESLGDLVGCPRLTDKAKRDVWSVIIAQYACKGCSPPHALLMARLVRILRRSEFDRDRGIGLWTPKDLQWRDFVNT